MSGMRLFPVDCPRCGRRGNAATHDAVNATFEPRLKERLMSGELLRWQCPACGQICSNVRPILYVDVARRFAIHWVAPEYACMVQEHRLMTPSGADGPDWREGARGYQWRLVREAEDLVEKINIFDAGLDDRAIEWLKYTLTRSVANVCAKEGGGGGMGWMEARFIKPLEVDGERRLQFVGPAVLDLPDNPPVPLSSIMPFRSYERALPHLELHLPLPAPVHDRFVIVDQAFIAERWARLPDLRPGANPKEP